MILHFTIPGVPVPWKRAQQKGKQFFTDPRVRAFKEAVAWSAKHAGARVTERPCTLAITCYMPIAASWSKNKRLEASADVLRHTSKPDWDNLGKGISDALNGVAWIDDSQVVYASVRKLYSENPRTDVTVQWLCGNP